MKSWKDTQFGIKLLTSSFKGLHSFRFKMKWSEDYTEFLPWKLCSQVPGVIGHRPFSERICPLDHSRNKSLFSVLCRDQQLWQQQKACIRYGLWVSPLFSRPGLVRRKQFLHHSVLLLEYCEFGLKYCEFRLIWGWLWAPAQHTGRILYGTGLWIMLMALSFSVWGVVEIPSKKLFSSSFLSLHAPHIRASTTSTVLGSWLEISFSIAFEAE